MSDTVIHTKALQKTYKEVEAVDGLNLSVPRGSIYGFLGRNGSGKTTTLKMLLGISHPTSGEIRIFEQNPVDRNEGVNIRRRIGFVSEEKQLYAYMTVAQMLKFTRPFFPTWDMALEQRLLSLFNLPLNRKIAKLSKGMRTQAALLLAMARGAELLILDEPTSGLDPAMTELMLQELVGLTASNNVTIFFSTHHLEEVEQIADHVCIIDRGKDLVHGVIDDIKQSYQRVHMVFDEQVPEAVLAAAGCISSSDRVLSVVTNKNIPNIVDQAEQHQALSVDVLPVTLKDIFLELVKAGTKTDDHRTDHNPL